MTQPNPRFAWRTFWSFQGMALILLRASFELGYGAVAAVQAWPWWAGLPAAALLGLLCALALIAGLGSPVMGLVFAWPGRAKASAPPAELYLPEAEPRRAASRAATRSRS